VNGLDGRFFFDSRTVRRLASGVSVLEHVTGSGSRTSSGGLLAFTTRSVQLSLFRPTTATLLEHSWIVVKANGHQRVVVHEVDNNRGQSALVDGLDVRFATGGQRCERQGRAMTSERNLQAIRRPGDTLDPGPRFVDLIEDLSKLLDFRVVLSKQRGLAIVVLFVDALNERREDAALEVGASGNQKLLVG